MSELKNHHEILGQHFIQELLKHAFTTTPSSTVKIAVMSAVYRHTVTGHMCMAGKVTVGGI